MNRYPWLEDYLLSKPGAQRDFKLEWQWHRWLVAGKMFAALCTPDPKYAEHAGHPQVRPPEGRALPGRVSRRSARLLLRQAHLEHRLPGRPSPRGRPAGDVRRILRSGHRQADQGPSAGAGPSLTLGPGLCAGAHIIFNISRFSRSMMRFSSREI